MSIIGVYHTIEPKDWLFPTHGDVIEAKRRADTWFKIHSTYDGAEQEIEEFVRQWALRQLIIGLLLMIVSSLMYWGF